MAAAATGAKMASSVAEPKWDTWTRSEIMAVRGYDASPGSAAPVGRTMTVDSLEVANGDPPPNGKPSAVTIPVATNATAASSKGSVAVPITEALPEGAHATVGFSTAERACSECGVPLPAQSRPEWVVCSQRCRQRRHDRMRKSRRPQVKALPLAAVPAPPEVDPTLHHWCLAAMRPACWRQSCASARCYRQDGKPRYFQGASPCPGALASAPTRNPFSNRAGGSPPAAAPG